MPNKLKYFKNLVGNSADFYIYGTIVDEKEPDFWTGEISKTEIDPLEFKEELENLNNISDINIFINSGGGSVFASSSIVSILNRYRENTGVKIHSFIDGLCASAATYLLFCADDVNVYQNSIMMIHKPMTIAFGNSNELQKEIETLNTLENNLMIPMYLKNAKVDEKEIKNLINNETWFNGNKEDKMFIGNFFNVNLLEESKQAVASISPNLYKNYKHIPDSLKSILKEENKQDNKIPTNNNKKENTANLEPNNTIDYSYFEEKIKNLKK